MDTAKILPGRWHYSDENTEDVDGTVLEFTKASGKGYGKDTMTAKFLLEDEAINATMECTLTAEGVVIEELGQEISNRYEGVISDDGRSISGTWLCTKSSMNGEDATNEGDSGQFLLKKGTSAAKEPDPALLYKGMWTYSDESTEAEDGTILQFTINDEGTLSASFVVEDAESEAQLECKLSDNGHGITIHEIGDYISNDYVGKYDTDSNRITGTWTCIKSEDEENVAVGDTGKFTLTKDEQ